MGLPAQTQLTADIAREVCERTGSAAVLDGSISRLGDQYVLALRATNCASGEVLDDQQERATRKDNLLNALTRMASKFRTRMGESSATVRKHNTPLAEATTTSIEALRAYDAGLKLHFSSGARAALPLFRRATEIDPEFAMAHSYLGRIYANLDESDFAMQSMRRAWQLRDRVSDREKLAIATRYAELVTGDLQGMRQASEACIPATHSLTLGWRYTTEPWLITRMRPPRAERSSIWTRAFRRAITALPRITFISTA